MELCAHVVVPVLLPKVVEDILWFGGLSDQAKQSMYATNADIGGDSSKSFHVLVLLPQAAVVILWFGASSGLAKQ